MKKFLKVFTIVLAVVAVIGGTAFIFFRNLKKQEIKTTSISALYNSNATKEFYSSLKKVNEDINAGVADANKDNRLDLIISTGERLDSYIFSLSSYYIGTETKIENAKIATELIGVNSSKSLLSRMITEFNIKKESEYYNRNKGINDLYVQACYYLIQDAELLIAINDSLSVDKSCDLKFNMFDVYANTILNNFEQFETVNGIVKLKNTEDVNIMNTHMKISSSIIETKLEPFAKEINQFNQFYSVCDKNEFALNLAENIALVQNAEQDSNAKIATYYFKLIYGI